MSPHSPLAAHVDSQSNRSFGFGAGDEKSPLPSCGIVASSIGGRGADAPKHSKSVKVTTVVMYLQTLGRREKEEHKNERTHIPKGVDLPREERRRHTPRPARIISMTFASSVRTRHRNACWVWGWGPAPALLCGDVWCPKGLKASHWRELLWWWRWLLLLLLLLLGLLSWCTSTTTTKHISGGSPPRSATATSTATSTTTRSTSGVLVHRNIRAKTKGH